MGPSAKNGINGTRWPRRHAPSRVPLFRFPAFSIFLFFLHSSPGLQRKFANRGLPRRSNTSRRHFETIANRRTPGRGQTLHFAIAMPAVVTMRSGWRGTENRGLGHGAGAGPTGRVGGEGPAGSRPRQRLLLHPEVGYKWAFPAIRASDPRAPSGFSSGEPPVEAECGPTVVIKNASIAAHK
jgi:hypothetical protein